MIETKHLTKRFGDLTAVDQLNIAIHKGETFGLLGPNGAGKTTTIKMLVGTLLPDSGEVFIGGKPDPTRVDVRRQIGNAPQDLALYEKLSAEENLSFFGHLFGLSGKALKERVEWTLEFSGLTGRKRDKVQTFSGGMKRRLNLAVALIHDPPVLLLDEPTVGVDPQSRNQIFDSIEQLVKEGRTIVYTTHYMEEAERLCDRVAIIDHGKILDCAAIDELVDRHGGESSIEVEFETLPDNLPDLGARIEGNHLSIKTDRPLESLNRLTNLGGKFRQMKMERPDLEDVFLNLTGRKLRD